jgi:hypothetical protein
MAAMAMGGPLTGSRQLGISDGANGAGKDAWREGRPAGTAGTTPGGVKLRNPEPVGGSGQANAVTAESVQGGVQTAGNRTLVRDDYGQLFARLVSHGMIWHRQETTGEGVKFSCLIANQQNPNIQHQHEATAADPVAALQAVLDRVEKGR